MSFADGLRRVWAVLTQPRQPLLPMLLERRRLRRDLEAAAPTFAIALPILGATPSDYDSDELVGRLEAAGLPRDEARRCVALLPIAFGRAVLFHRGWRHFDDTVLIGDGGGPTLELHLSDQQLYRAGLHVALHAMHAGTLDKAIVQGLANMSGEARLLAEMIARGETAGGMTTGLFGYDPGLFVLRRH